jgi:hypothetical protein
MSKTDNNYEKDRVMSWFRLNKRTRVNIIRIATVIGLFILLIFGSAFLRRMGW